LQCVVTRGGGIAELETMPLNTSWSKFQKTTKNALDSFFIYNIGLGLNNLWCMYPMYPTHLPSLFHFCKQIISNYCMSRLGKPVQRKPPCCKQLLCKNKMQECLALRNSSLSWKYPKLDGNYEQLKVINMRPCFQKR